MLGQKTGSNYITYLYDENGTAYGLIYNNTYFYYMFNAQGDVVGIVNASGNVIARYDYDAWGNILSITSNSGADISQNVNHIANINPIRYRGYYYDYETGFYYLQSRYYDPVTQRFLNADSYVSTGQGILGYNMFAYCGNNPINRADTGGEVWQYVVVGVIGAVVNVTTTFISAKAMGQEYTWADAGVAALAGGVIAIPTYGVYISAAISGGYSIYKSYEDGASLGTSLFTGIVSAAATVGGIGNLASYSGVTLNLVESTVTDLVFGTGYNIVSDAINKSVTTNYNNSSKNNATCAPSIIRNSIQTSNTRIVNGTTIKLSKNSTYVDDKYSNRIYCKVTLY